MCLGVGALYPPCMRDDIGTNVALAQLGYDVDLQLGCCEVASHNVAGTSTLEECQTLSNGLSSAHVSLI